jgi:hypothetical protein
MGNTDRNGISGIFNQYSAFTLTNSIVDTIFNYNYGSLTYGGSNLVQSVSSIFSTYSGPAPLTNDPGLLQWGSIGQGSDHGGPTKTMPPAPGSPVIGAGDVTANTFTTDQRGYPRTQNGRMDLGAVELPLVPPFTANPTKGFVPSTVRFSSTNADSDGSAIVGWNWSFGDGKTSSLQNPTNVYGTAASFSPRLFVTNSLGLPLSVPGPAVSTYQLLPIAGVSRSGTNLTLSGSNGVSGVTYTVLTSTNLKLPLIQWTPLVTNTWSSNGPFSLVLTNVQNPPVPARFFLLLSLVSLNAQASLSLNGAGQDVQVPLTIFTQPNLTLEAWVYPTTLACNTILSRGDGNMNNYTDFILDVGYDGTNCGTMTVGFMAAGAWDASSNTVALNTWSHVAVTYDGTNKQFYINGVLDSTSARPGSLFSDEAPLYIGRQGAAGNAGNYFNGQLAEVRVWNTVRTAGQIQSDMNFSSIAQPGLLAHYHLNEGSGTNAYDASGNDNTGILEGGASWSNLVPP